MQEFELWKDSLTDSEQKAATGFFSVIKRHGESKLDGASCHIESDVVSHVDLDHNTSLQDLYVVPYSKEYSARLLKAAELLKKAAELTDSPR